MLNFFSNAIIAYFMTKFLYFSAVHQNLLQMNKPRRCRLSVHATRMLFAKLEISLEHTAKCTLNLEVLGRSSVTIYWYHKDSLQRTLCFECLASNTEYHSCSKVLETKCSLKAILAVPVSSD